MKTLPPGSDLRYRWDPLAFTRSVLGWRPDPKQAEALAHRGLRVVLNWARQCGKSTVCAARALHLCATRPNSLVLVLGGVGIHLAEFFTKVDDFIYNAPTDWVGGPVKGMPGRRFARRFPNGSRIIGVTTNRSVRGHTASLVILDEAGYIENAVWDGVLPTLATTRGAVWVVGTPNGARGWYYDLWKNSGKSPVKWFKSQYKARENSRISEEFLLEMRFTKGEAFIRQEFECEFLHDGTALLNPEDIDKLFVSRER